MSGINPRGTTGTPVAILGGTAHSISFTGTSAKNSTAFSASTRILAGIVATQPCFIRAGDSTVVATTADTFLAANAVYTFGIDSNITHIAVIQETGAGTLRFFESRP